MLCYGQRQWVWGPSGYGAILLVNCDKDDANCYDQDNCDQHVHCLQGEGEPRVTAPPPRRDSRLWQVRSFPTPRPASPPDVYPWPAF